MKKYLLVLLMFPSFSFADSIYSSMYYEEIQEKMRVRNLLGESFDNNRCCCCCKTSFELPKEKEVLVTPIPPALSLLAVPATVAIVKKAKKKIHKGCKT